MCKYLQQLLINNINLFLFFTCKPIYDYRLDGYVDISIYIKKNPKR